MPAPKIASRPIDIDRFMQQHNSTYYAQADRFGAKGDFITAPEISQVFGEMMALHLVMLRQAYGAFAGEEIFFEAGAGRGTLALDMRRVFQKFCPELAAAQIYFLEASACMRDKLAARFSQDTPIFIDQIEHLPPCRLFGIANEFFDALGVKQIIAQNGFWYWRVIEQDTNAGETKFRFGRGARLTEKETKILALPPPTTDDMIIEISPEGRRYVQVLARHLAQFGGAFLICDYGKNDGYGDSVQAVKHHRAVPIFAHVGSSDLTHLVDFHSLAKQAEHAGARLIGPVEQGVFLKEMGIMARAETLGRPKNATARRDLAAAIDRLCAPQNMGRIFKVALLVPQGEGMPIGFQSLLKNEGGQNAGGKHG